MEKAGVNIVILEGTFFIINPESFVLVAKKTILGITRKGKTICGDVDFESASKTAGFLTPVPGGIGPLTVTFLLHNTILCAEKNTRISRSE